MNSDHGQSGGPVWVYDSSGGASQVGVHSDTNAGFSVAAHGQDWFDAVAFIRKQFP
jgi:hypothetical protein